MVTCGKSKWNEGLKQVIDSKGTTGQEWMMIAENKG